jgi:hypothetical protein
MAGGTCDRTPRMARREPPTSQGIPTTGAA